MADRHRARRSGALAVSVRWDGKLRRPAERIDILLPASLQGALAVRGARVEHDAQDGVWRRLVVAFDG